MSIPVSIKGITLTAEERYKFAKYNLTRSMVANRIRSGMDRSKLFEPRKVQREIKINGNIVTDEILEIMTKNDITLDKVRHSIFRGWTFERAITTPKLIQSSNYELEDEIHEDSLIEAYIEERELNKMKSDEVTTIIGRIKFLNKKKKYEKAPLTIPKGVMIRAREYGIDIDHVKEVPV